MAGILAPASGELSALERTVHLRHEYDVRVPLSQML